MSETDDIEVYLQMRTEIHFRKRKGARQLSRTLIIEKDEVIKNNQASNWPYQFDVNFFVEWVEGDPRDKSILSGRERVQNVVVDVRQVLITLQRMFPELSVCFSDSLPPPES